jgi:uncharacterized membrane protein YeaQ/YmgE (transglycosylase-associated protein family)
MIPERAGDLVYSALIGLAAGFVASRLTKRGGLGWLGYLVVGVLGGLLGAFLFGLLGIGESNPLERLIGAILGAVLLLVLLSLATRKRA